MNRENKAYKNPLYVVTNQGQDVEACHSLWDILVKKLNLAPIIQVLENLLVFILGQIQSYPGLVFFNDFIENFLKTLPSFKRT